MTAETAETEVHPMTAVTAETEEHPMTAETAETEEHPMTAVTAVTEERQREPMTRATILKVDLSAMPAAGTAPARRGRPFHLTGRTAPLAMTVWTTASIPRIHRWPHGTNA